MPNFLQMKFYFFAFTAFNIVLVRNKQYQYEKISLDVIALHLKASKNKLSWKENVSALLDRIIEVICQIFVREREYVDDELEIACGYAKPQQLNTSITSANQIWVYKWLFGMRLLNIFVWGTRRDVKIPEIVASFHPSVDYLGCKKNNTYNNKPNRTTNFSYYSEQAFNINNYFVKLIIFCQILEGFSMS